MQAEDWVEETPVETLPPLREGEGEGERRRGRERKERAQTFEKRESEDF